MNYHQQLGTIFYLKEKHKKEFIYQIKNDALGSKLPKENEAAINYLLKQGYKMIESSTDQRFKRREFIPSDLQNPIVKINHDNYPEFARYHDSKASDIYWNSKRIKQYFDSWILYSYWSENQLRASIAARKIKNTVEIFALSIDEEKAHKGIEEDLITVTLKEGFEDQNIEDVVFFIDSNDKSAEAYSKKLGFKAFTHYRCLCIRL